MPENYIETVEKALYSTTPGNILALFRDWPVELHIGPKDPEGVHRGTMSRFVREFVITVRRQESRDKELQTLLHELFHIRLIAEGLDNVDDQLYDDNILETATRRFMEKYPLYPQMFWDHLITARPHH